MPRFSNPRFWRLGTASALVLGAAAIGTWFARDWWMDSPKPHEALVGRYCLDCHNSTDLTANLSFEHADFTDIGAKPDLWEAVVRKLRAGMMPPADASQPGQKERKEQRAKRAQAVHRQTAWLGLPNPRLWRPFPEGRGRK